MKECVVEIVCWMSKLMLDCNALCVTAAETHSVFGKRQLVPTSGLIVMSYKTSLCWDGFGSFFLEFGPGYCCFLVFTGFVGLALILKAKSVPFCILGGILTHLFIVPVWGRSGGALLLAVGLFWSLRQGLWGSAWLWLLLCRLYIRFHTYLNLGLIFFLTSLFMFYGIKKKEDSTGRFSSCFLSRVFSCYYNRLRHHRNRAYCCVYMTIL